MKHKTITFEEIKHQEEFSHYQLLWMRHIEQTVEHGNKTFKNFAIDSTQIPCLLIMNMIDFLREDFDKETYNSFKDFIHEVLEGNIPRKKHSLKIVK